MKVKFNIFTCILYTWLIITSNIHHWNKLIYKYNYFGSDGASNLQSD